MSELVLAHRRSDLQTLDDKILYAEKLAASGLLPDSYKRNPANVLWAIEYGDMIGLQPMAAMTGVHVIKGKPTASSGLISGLVRSAGHKMQIGYDKKTGTGWATIVRSDDPTFTFRAEWNTEKAVTAGLCEVKNGKIQARDNKGDPTPWEKYPEAMKKARATTEVAREACEEVLFGLHYTPEELGANVDQDGEPISVPSERTDTRERDAATAALVGTFREQALAAEDVEQLRALRGKAQAAGLTGFENTIDAAGQQVTLGDLITALGRAKAGADEAPAQPPVSEVVDAEVVEDAPATTATVPVAAAPAAPVVDPNRPVEHPMLVLIDKLLSTLPVTVRTREQKLTLTRELVGRYMAASTDMTHAEAMALVTKVQELLKTEGNEAVFAEYLGRPLYAEPAQAVA